MPRLDARFERLARRLSVLQLRPAAPDDFETSIGMARSPAFVDTYNEAGLRTVIAHYGLDEKLKERGLADYRLVIHEEDPFHHRLEIVLDDPSLPDPHVMDLRLHLARLSLPDETERVDVVAIEWLLMQNPRASFTPERPRLPGQKFPGTGLGADVAALLVLMCRRIKRDAIVVVPERYHLAELYARGGWLAPSSATDRLIDEVKLAAPKLSFAGRAWAMERGCVFDEDGAPAVYVPEERIMPISDAVERALAPGGSWLRSLLAPRRRLYVDVLRLAHTLEEDPVEGMDPAHLES